MLGAGFMVLMYILLTSGSRVSRGVYCGFEVDVGALLHSVFQMGLGYTPHAASSPSEVDLVCPWT